MIEMAYWLPLQKHTRRAGRELNTTSFKLQQKLDVVSIIPQIRLFAFHASRSSKMGRIVPSARDPIIQRVRRASQNVLLHNINTYLGLNSPKWVLQYHYWTWVQKRIS